mmetsp:Transcript_1954/g.3393  ORF Transcript_1954/g.3393 Transcript_1954/m.3393 type:complete len:473 (-) Transcript_1954:349-1767(-)
MVGEEVRLGLEVHLLDKVEQDLLVPHHAGQLEGVHHGGVELFNSVGALQVDLHAVRVAKPRHISEGRPGKKVLLLTRQLLDLGDVVGLDGLENPDGGAALLQGLLVDARELLNEFLVDAPLLAGHLLVLLLDLLHVLGVDALRYPEDVVVAQAAAQDLLEQLLGVGEEAPHLVPHQVNVHPEARVIGLPAQILLEELDQEVVLVHAARGLVLVAEAEEAFGRGGEGLGVVDLGEDDGEEEALEELLEAALVGLVPCMLHPFEVEGLEGLAVQDHLEHLTLDVEALLRDGEAEEHADDVDQVLERDHVVEVVEQHEQAHRPILDNEGQEVPELLLLDLVLVEAGLLIAKIFRHLPSGVSLCGRVQMLDPEASAQIEDVLPDPYVVDDVEVVANEGEDEWVPGGRGVDHPPRLQHPEWRFVIPLGEASLFGKLLSLVEHGLSPLAERELSILGYGLSPHRPALRMIKLGGKVTG